MKHEVKDFVGGREKPGLTPAWQGIRHSAIEKLGYGDAERLVAQPKMEFQRGP